MCGPERCRVSFGLHEENMRHFGSLPFQTDRFSNALVGCILAVLRAGCTAPQDDDEGASRLAGNFLIGSMVEAKSTDQAERLVLTHRFNAANLFSLQTIRVVCIKIQAMPFVSLSHHRSSFNLSILSIMSNLCPGASVDRVILKL